MGGLGQRPPPPSATTDPQPCPAVEPTTCGRPGTSSTVIAVPASARLPWHLVAMSTVLALAAAVGAYMILDGDDDAPESTNPTLELTPEEDLPAAEDVTFTTFDDEEVALASLRGRPLVVNFFASTCVPCITEMPAFEAVFQDVGGEVSFLGLAVADRADDAQALVERTGVTYPTAQDRDSTVINALGGTVLPTTVLLDADGEIVARRFGEIDADELRALLADELGIAP